jgi:hypothetical protein
MLVKPNFKPELPFFIAGILTTAGFCAVHRYRYANDPEYKLGVDDPSKAKKSIL